MRRVKGKETSIEVMLRKALWHAGIRYRKDYRKLIGRIDIAITKHRIAIFCDGDFWHGRTWDGVTTGVKTNRQYWDDKIAKNVRRDAQVTQCIQSFGWMVIRFWETDIRKDLSGCVDAVKETIRVSIESSSTSRVVSPSVDYP
jgi:DNA mismatch endonuclease (patch repair protein)